MRVIGGRFRSRLLVAPKGAATRPTSDRLRETLFNILAARAGGLEGVRFVDLYAGTGAVGIEAVSRGAAQVWLAEKAEPALKAIRANLKALGIGESRAEGDPRSAEKMVVEARGTMALLERLAKAAMSQGLKAANLAEPLLPGLKSRPISEAEARKDVRPGNAKPFSSGVVDVVFLDPPWEADFEYAQTLEFLGSERGRAMLAEDSVVIAEHSAKKKLAERYGALMRTREMKQGDAGLTFYRLEKVEPLV
ncbi:MAG TPA: RsmD family RNA methyltransferase [Acidobacteriaceae bacterium]|nr:RsmD family RNA methyltransferase [Acidobacteriaceae bacterium]